MFVWILGFFFIYIYILNVGLYTRLASFSLLGLQVCVTTPVTPPHPPPLPFLLVCQFEGSKRY